VHQGLLAADAGLTVVAIHGFAPRAGDPDVILSNANTVACWNGVADQLNVELPSHVTVQYPEDIHELGRTTGAQAGGSDRFRFVGWLAQSLDPMEKPASRDLF